MKLFFPNFAISCLNTIENNGFEAWFVGGAVRDALLNREFYDVDITTNALPEDIIKMFPKTIPTGIKHGTVTVMIEDNPIEVTTYRSDMGYSDNRHPEAVKFENNIESDLSRRDFTINALAYHPKRGFLDLFGGLSDINAKKIAAVGNPEKRFSEDALRILRAFRFSSVLGFEIENSTLNAAYICAERISSLSGERILTELKKLSIGENPDVITPLINRGAFMSFGILSSQTNFNDISKIKDKYKTAVLLSQCDLNLNVFKEKLKPDNALYNNIVLLKEIYKMDLPNSKTELKLLLSAIGKENEELYYEAVKLFAPDCKMIEIIAYMEEIKANGEPYTVKDLDINGYDLMKLQISGVEIGVTLEKLNLAVISNPSLNDKEKLIKLVNKIM